MHIWEVSLDVIQYIHCVIFKSRLAFQFSGSLLFVEDIKMIILSNISQEKKSQILQDPY